MAQIDKPNLHFNTKLYTGNGSTNAQTGVGFQPDWVWIKSRSQAVNHYGFDAVRGATKGLSQNINNAESTRDSTWFNSFDSDGFTIGSEANINNNASTYASWNWKAGNSAGSSNSNGSITSTVSANTTSGFSIVTYTGVGGTATIGHGLGAVPKLVITKSLNAADSWYIYHAGMGNNKSIVLDTTAANYTSVNWNSTTPTTSVFSVGAGDANTSGRNFVAYCFAEKKGFSKFGSYTGAGGTNYPFIYTGFKPAFVMAKRTNDTSNWVMYDNKRQYNLIEGQYNPQRPRLASNLSSAESSFTSDNGVDLLSNGFVVRDNSNDAYTINISGSTYIYMAFAENPIVGSNNVAATAR